MDLVDSDSAELHDWEEVLHPDAVESGTVVVNSQIQGHLDGIERESEGIIRPDYFSLDSHHPKYLVAAGDLTDDGASVESDNPSWIDPGSADRYARKEFWPDLSSDRSSDDGKYADFEVRSELGLLETDKTHEMVFDGIGSGSESSVLMKKSEITSHGDESGDDNKPVEIPQEEGKNENVAIEASEPESNGGNSSKGAIWWKLPLDILRYCVFKASPVWTISVAAAMMGVVILSRRLYKMKRRTRNLPLKVTVDDKKVSQFMSRAAKLNEAFSVVKRVPVIRPGLPAAGVAPWPMMSLR